jgi:hypothetical protein
MSTPWDALQGQLAAGPVYDTWDDVSKEPVRLEAPTRCGQWPCPRTDLVQHHVRAKGGFERRWALCSQHDRDLPDHPRSPCQCPPADPATQGATV